MKLTLPADEARSVVYDDHFDAKTILREIVDTSRWSIRKRIIFRWKDGNLYSGYYSVGATEMQSECPFEFEKEVSFVRVEPYEKTVTDYREVAD